MPISVSYTSDMKPHDLTSRSIRQEVKLDAMPRSLFASDLGRYTFFSDMSVRT
jgi:hypothetical protein